MRKRLTVYDLQFTIFQKGWEFLIYGLSFLFAVLMETWLQTLICFMAFNIIRPAFPRTFHHDVFMRCVAWSTTMFTVSAFSARLFPIGVTIFGGVIIAYICCYVLYFVQTLYEAQHRQKPLNALSVEELKLRCIERKIKPDRVPYIVDLFGTMNEQDIANKYIIAIDTVYQDRWRYKKKLK